MCVPSQRAEMHVDTYGRSFEGHVDSIAGATGAKLSLLPPENATGNFVKIVQRIPVKIALDHVAGRLHVPSRHERGRDHFHQVEDVNSTARARGHRDATDELHMETKPAINPWLIASIVLLATFMEVLDTSVANVALPHIAGNLSASVDEATWVLTAYLVANAIVLPLSGWFSTLFGRKRFYMACVGIFTVSSLLCGVAPTLGSLIFFRILQGLGGGALQPISQAILVESFPREKQGVAMAFYGMGVVVAPVIGPTLGGWITDNYTLALDLPDQHPGRHPLARADGGDDLRSAAPRPEDVRQRAEARLHRHRPAEPSASPSLEILLDEGQRNDWFGSNMIVAAAVIAVVALVAVVVWELRQDQPVVDFRILANRNFALAAVIMYAVGFTLYGSTAHPADLPADDSRLHGAAQRPGALARRHRDDDRHADRRPAARTIPGALADRVRAAWWRRPDCSGCRASTSTSTSAPRCGRARFRRWAWRSCSCRSTPRRSAP